MQDTQPTTQPRWYWNIPIVLLVGILMSLGIRGLIKDDARYSWGTFCKQITYKVEYKWIIRDSDGKLSKQKRWHDNKIPDELRGEARTHLVSNRQLNTRYSLGSLKSWAAAYTKYMYEHRDEFRPGEEIVGFTAEILYRVNVSRRLRERDLKKLEQAGDTSISPRRRLFIAYPPTIKDPQATSDPNAKTTVVPLNFPGSETDSKDDDA